MIKKIVAIMVLLSIQISADDHAINSFEDVSFNVPNNTKVYAYWAPTTQADSSPSIILFHQAGSSALGEYQEIYPKLLAEGFNVLMVDLRSGGNRFNSSNKTVAELDGKEFSYCEAYPDMVASLKWLKTKKLSGPVIVWGSSYSAGLVFNLAADNKGKVDGVLGFSPASGKPMEGCDFDVHLKNISVPAIAFRPKSEMKYDFIKAQVYIFKTFDIPTIIIKNGVHGSSMLVEKRTHHNMQQAWQEVLIFLNQFKTISA